MGRLGRIQAGLEQGERIFEIVEASNGGKVLHAIESSHDVPTGSNTYIIALTKRESWCINGLLMQTDFESIDEFVEKNIEKSLGRKKEKEEER